MNTLLKLLTVMLVMNIFVYIGVNFAIAQDSSNQLNPDLKFYYKGDIIEKLLANSLDDITQNTKENWTDYDVAFNSNISNYVQKKGGATLGQGGISFLDALDIVWSFIGTLWNIAASPVILFMNFRMPVIIGLILGIPMTILYITCLVLMIRGVGD